MTPTRKIAGFVAAGLAVAAAIPLLSTIVSAADHLDAPKSKANLPADITDIYAWHTDDGKIVAVVNVAGFTEAGQPPQLDAKILYGIHIDQDGDGVADLDTWVRFGQNEAGDWGVQVTGLPGGEAVVSGPIETTIDAGLGLRVYAGLRDDPFFFDLDGFQKTLMTGNLSFDKMNDTFAKTNVTSIVVEMSTDAVVGAGNTFQLWASTRVPG